MEKFGVSKEELKSELSQELTSLLEKRNSLVKTAGAFGEGVKSVETQIEAIKSKIASLETPDAS